MLDNYFIETNFPIEEYHDEIVEEFEKLGTFKQYITSNKRGKNVWPYHGKYMVARLDDVKDAHILQFVEQEFYQMYGIKTKGRYLDLPPNYEITPHFDDGTLCSFNYIIEGDSPIIFDEDNLTINYKKGLLNISKVHSVPASTSRRKLLKLSIADHTFEEVKQKIEESSVSS